MIEVHKSEFSESGSVRDWSVGLLHPGVALGTLSDETRTVSLGLWSNLDAQ